jgi:hypothetical protein
MLTDLERIFIPAIVSYIWLLTPLGGLIIYKANRLHLKKWLMFPISKLTCSHCVPTWVTIFMCYNDKNLLILIFLNIVLTKITIRYV